MIGKRIDTSLEVSWATDASGTVSIVDNQLFVKKVNDLDKESNNIRF